jgi:hypothetical protein
MRDALNGAIYTFAVIAGYALAGWAGIVMIVLPVLLWNLRR